MEPLYISQITNFNNSRNTLANIITLIAIAIFAGIIQSNIVWYFIPMSAMLGSLLLCVYDLSLMSQIFHDLATKTLEECNTKKDVITNSNAAKYTEKINKISPWIMRLFYAGVISFVAIFSIYHIFLSEVKPEYKYTQIDSVVIRTNISTGVRNISSDSGWK